MNAQNSPLTEREIEIVRQTALGLKAPEISNKLQISRKTVDKHRANVEQKLNLHTVVMLVRYAIDHSIVKLKRIRAKRLLSKRQEQVARLIAANYSNKMIADRLNLSIKTVEGHREELHRKLDIHWVVDVVHFIVAQERAERTGTSLTPAHAYLYSTPRFYHRPC